MLTSDTKAEKAVLKIAEKSNDALKTNGTLGTKVLLHIGDEQNPSSKSSLSSRNLGKISSKEAVKEVNKKEKRLIENQLRKLFSG